MLSPWYQPAPFFMVRVPSLPFSLFTQLAESGHIEDFQEKCLEQRWHEAYLMSLETLAQYVRHPLVEQALIIASPSLYRALYELPTQQVDKDRRTSRAYERLLRYLIRMSSRPTPFGTCAGVAFGSFGQKSCLQLSEKRMLALRPDMRWLSAFLSSIEERFLSSLRVQVSTSLTLLGQRACIWQQNHRGTQSERVWLRMTPLLQTVCLYARQPIHYMDLKHRLLSDFPHVRDEHMETFLRTLYQRGVLLTTLFPPDDVEPFAHICSQLQTSTDAAPLVKQLCSFQNVFRFHQALTNVQLDAIQQQQSTLTPHFEDVTLHVDTRQSLNQHELTSEIGKKAASVAETLLRIGLYPLGLPSVHRARRLFLERHEEQEVPLLDLFRPDGVFDNLYQQDMDLNDLPTLQQERITERNHFLRMLAMQAVNARQKHIELTPDLIERLSCCPATQELSPPALLDLYMQVMAESQDAIDQGKWYGYASLLPLGGRSYRRFLHLYEHDESVQSQIRDLWRINDALNPETLHATLAMYPSNMRDLNVMHGPLSNQYILPLHRASLSSTEQTIFPDDVLVSVRSGQFLLRSRFHNKPIRVTQPHMLSFTHLPPMARFLLEASHDGEAFPGAFQWGAAGDLPFIPRLVQGNTILSLAQWTLTEAILQLENHIVEPVDWFRAIQHWRGQWNVPRYVYLLEKEDRLLLDLECVLMVDLLRQELFKKGREKKKLQLQEAPPLEQMAWLRDQKGISYLSEFVIPLTRRTASPKPPSLPSVHKEISQVERCFLPGQEWLYIKLYLPEGLHNTLLTGPLHSFLQEHRAWFRGWFFVRYHDPQAHIRLRFFVPDKHHREQLLHALLVWSHERQAEGLLLRSTLDTYERETERYGGPEAISAIESVFCAQSEAACALLLQQKQASPLLFEAVYALDRLWTDWGYDLSTRYQLAQRRFSPYKEPQALREQRKPLLAFLSNPPEHTKATFEHQRSVISQTARTISHLAQCEALCRDEEDILWSLSHMSCNRLLGTKRTYEQDAYRLWVIALKTRYHTA